MGIPTQHEQALKKCVFFPRVFTQQVRLAIHQSTIVDGVFFEISPFQNRDQIQHASASKKKLVERHPFSQKFPSKKKKQAKESPRFIIEKTRMANHVVLVVCTFSARIKTPFRSIGFCGCPKSYPPVI